uniref:Alpha-tocopherol transfer protein-like n=1 Tax=Hirondellea gigas TaxID=1518452 RepID=A0A2P2IBN3_9CRUS
MVLLDPLVFTSDINYDTLSSRLTLKMNNDIPLIHRKFVSTESLSSPKIFFRIDRPRPSQSTTDISATKRSLTIPIAPIYDPNLEYQSGTQQATLNKFSKAVSFKEKLSGSNFNNNDDDSCIEEPVVMEEMERHKVVHKVCSSDVDRRKVDEEAKGYLPAEYFAEAEQDLHEKQEWIERDVEALRELLLKEPGLRARTDTPFLLAFLRARKFDYEKALAMVVGYYKARLANQSFYAGLTASALHHVWEKRLQTVLRQPDHTGRTVIIFRAGAWNPSELSLDDLFRAQVLLLEHVVRCPITQLKGVAAVVDCQGLGRNHAYNFTPAHIRRMLAVVQEVFPLRFKALHFIHEPIMFEWMFSIVKPLLSETIKGRLHFHGSSYAALHEHIPAEALPQELGGHAPPLDNTRIVELLQEQDQYFLDHFSYGYTSPDPILPTSLPRGQSASANIASNYTLEKYGPLTGSSTFTEGLHNTPMLYDRGTNNNKDITSFSDDLPPDGSVTPTATSSNPSLLGSVADVGSFIGSYYRRMCIE